MVRTHVRGSLKWFAVLIAISPAVALAQAVDPDKGAATASSDTDTAVIALNVWAITVSPKSTEGAEVPVIRSGGDVRDFLARLKSARRLRESFEVRLTTVAANEAYFQSGADEPSIVGTNTTERGRINTIQYRSLGTIVVATPYVEAGGILRVKLRYEASYLDKAKGVQILEPKDGDEINADQIRNDKINTMVRLKSGDAAIVSSDAVEETSADENDDQKTDGEERFVILAAEIRNVD